MTVTHVATFPGSPAALEGRPLPAAAMTSDASVTLDMKRDLASFGNLGILTAALSKNTLSGKDLSFIKHITATIAAEDGKMPVELAVDLDIPEGSTETELSLRISDARLLQYFLEGKVAVHFYVTGNIPPRPITLTHTMIAHLNVAVNGSVLKL